MKLKNIIVMSMLSSLLLFGCGSNTSSSAFSEETTSSNVETSSISSTSKTNSSFSSEMISSDSNITSSISKDSSPISSSIPEETLWEDDIVDLMDEYLDGHIIPYIDMGDFAYGYWSNTASTYGNIIINGSNTFKQSFLDQVNQDYTMAGWEVNQSSSTLMAGKESLGLSIELMENPQDNTPLLNIYYEEPYDENNQITSWNNDILDTFHDHLDDHILPYFYLGTKHPYAGSYITASDYFIIHGGRWDERVISNARTVFRDEGWTISEADDVTGPTLTASKTYEDGCIVKAVVSNYSLTKKKAIVRVSFEESFNQNSTSNWTQEILDLFDDSFDSHQVPYIYIGSNNPTLSYQYQIKKATITGGKYDSRVLTYAKAALETDLFEVKESYDNYGNTIVAEKTFEDGCTLFITVSRNSFNKAQVVIEYMEGLTIPDNVSWDGLYTENLPSYMLGHKLPYFYMGTSDVKLNFRNQPTSKSITLIGDTFNGHMPFWAKEAFEKEGWTTSLEKNLYGYDFKAEKTFDDGCRFVASMPAVATYNAQLDTNAILTIDVYEAYLAHNPSHYDSDIIVAMSLLFKRALPYIYLGTSFPTLTSDSSLKSMSLIGSYYDASMLTDFETAFNSDTLNLWSISEISNGKKAVCTTSSGDTITATISKNVNNLPQLDFLYQDKFEAPVDGAWSDTLTNYFNIILNQYVPPYLYLGTEVNKYYSSNLNAHSIIIKGGTFNKQVLSIAKDTLEADGWTTATGTNNYADTLDATKRDDIKNVTYRCRVEKDGSSDLSKAQVTFCMDEDVTLDESKDYTDEVKQVINANFDNHMIPYLDFGYDPTAAIINNGSLCLTYKGYLKNDYINKVKDKFSSLGWTIRDNKLFNSNPSYYFSTLMASYEDSVDHSKMYLSFLPTLPVAEESTFNVFVSYYKPYEIIDNGSYDQDTINAMKTALGNHVLPYIYLGCETPTLTYTANSITMTGGTWDDDIFTKTKSALTSDTLSGFTWGFYTDKTSSASDILVCNGYEEASKDTITLKVYDAINLTYASHTPTLNASFAPGFVIPDITSWSDDIKEKMNNFLGGNVIPYIYLGCANNEIRISYNYNSHVMRLEGGLWDDQIYTLAKNALVNDLVDLDGDGIAETTREWTCYEDITSLGGKTVVASCICPYDSSKTITIKVYPTTSGKPTLDIYYI